MTKRELGQYYTVSNPFKHPLFSRWMEIVGPQEITEPFAGSNNIIKLMREAGYSNTWKCFDIDPPTENACPEFVVEKMDTIECFPCVSDVCVTNPPYLGKSSARRRKINYPWEEDDIYKTCLNVMLRNCGYVAAIIPESFITSGEHSDRLFGVISLNCQMFDDTDCPVCLAMFVPNTVTSSEVWTMDERLGTMQELRNIPLTASTEGCNWTFNDKDGEIGIKTVDSSVPDCEFFRGERIDPESIKVSSRSFTRVSGVPSWCNVDEFISRCNAILKDYRSTTRDVLMTSFKGLRKDGRYRRRLDFRTARCIMNEALKEQSQ